MKLLSLQKRGLKVFLSFELWRTFQCRCKAGGNHKNSLGAWRNLGQCGFLGKSFELNGFLWSPDLSTKKWAGWRFSSGALGFLMFPQLVYCVLFEGHTVAYTTFSDSFLYIICMAFDGLELSSAPALTWQRDVPVSISRCIPPRLFHMLHLCLITTAFIVASDHCSCRHWWKTWPSLLTHDLQWVWPSDGNQAKWWEATAPASLVETNTRAGSERVPSSINLIISLPITKKRRQPQFTIYS